MQTSKLDYNKKTTTDKSFETKKKIQKKKIFEYCIKINLRIFVLFPFVHSLSEFFLHFKK